jgi:RHS repeat-associated protein
MKKLITICLMAVTSVLFAAHEHTINSLAGEINSPIVSGASVTLSDQWYPFPAGWNSIFRVHNADGMVTLRYDDGRRTFTNKRWTLQVNYTITTWDASGTPSTPVGAFLNIDYDPVQGIKYTDRDRRKYSGVHQLKVDVASLVYNEWDVTTSSQTVTNGTSIPSFLSDIYLDVELDVERYYNLSTAPAASVGTTFSSYDNELQVAWSYIQGAESYDVEWLFIDSGDDANPLTAGYDYDWSNATRVNVPDQHYNISLAYPKGLLLVRVRGVGIDWDNYVNNGLITRATGVWDSPTQTGNTLGYGGVYYEIINGMLPEMNWTYSAGFAEDGKRIDGASFYDGMMRGRESITTVNSDGNVIVGQTLYDYEGRPAVAMMPYAETSQGIRYYVADAAYNREDFDTDIAIENPDAVDITSGAGQYYSTSSNAFGMDNATPDAVGYPYSRVVYMNDGTNRPMKTAAAGEDLSMQGDKETHYYYGTPTQGQLDRLFGNEVGYASHYKKNFVIDPNGVVSVSYIDQSGNVIATALAGETPDNLQPIDNPNGNPNTAVAMSDDLMVNNAVSNDGMGTESQFTLTVTEESVHTFTYVLNSAGYCSEDRCYAPCADCVYDVSITIFNALTGELIDLTPQDNPIIENATTAEVISFTVTLPVGTYRILKVTRLNQAHLTQIRTDFVNAQLENPTTACVQPGTPNPTPCAVDCHAACEDHYFHDGQYYNDEGAVVSSTVGQVLIDYCKQNLCDQPPVPNPCEVKYQAMLAAMSPGGEYFDNRPDAYTLVDDTLHQEVNPHYHINGWLNAHEQSTDMLNEINNYPTTGAHSFTTWTEVRDNWDPDFAALLVKYHPEYCTWEYFCNWDCIYIYDTNPPHMSFDTITYTQGDAWDWEMATLWSTTGNYSGSNGEYWNPLDAAHDNTSAGVTGDNSGYQPYNIDNPLHQDPWFAGECDFNICDDPSLSAKDALNNYLGNYYLAYDANDDPLQYYSIWYVIANPDNINTGSYNTTLSAGTIDFFKTLHGDGTTPGLISTTPGPGQVTPYQYFRSVYFYYRNLVIEQGYAGNADAATCRSTYTPSVPAHDADGYLVPDDVYNGQTPQGYTILFPRNPLIDLYSAGCSTPSSEDLGLAIEDLVNAAAENPNNINNPETSSAGCSCYMLEQFANARGISLTDYSGIASALNDEYEPTVAYTATQVQNWFTECVEEEPSMTVLTGLGYPEDITCNTDAEITDPVQAAYDNCMQDNGDLAAANAWFEYIQQVNEAADAYLAGYIEKCIDNITVDEGETFNVEYNLHEYYYTLYYYDQAGNLVKTVPPEGVNLITNPTDLNEVKDYRTDFRNNNAVLGGVYTPAVHDMRSQYAYNSLQQPVKAWQNEGGSNTPESWESGETRFWYDYLGRMIVSQNSKQAGMSPPAYSYTYYDELGRIYEVGERHTTTTLEDDNTGSRNSAGEYYYFDIASATTYDTWSLSGTTNDITTTYYDEAPTLTNSAAPAAFASGQENLRNRVAAVVYDDNPTLQYDLYNFSASGQPGYLNAYFYSYDIHGNVNQVVQETPPLKTHNQNIKSTTYEYDLVSGNVNAVHYQNDERDEFHHRYEYDADNRLKVSYTSRDGEHWEKETKQFYYATGGMGRVEIGDKTVQAMDYAFTINGWLKGMNRNIIGDNGMYQDRDLGQDGVNNSSNINRNIATDAAGFTLHYYKPSAGISNDYLSVHTVPDFAEDLSGTAYGADLVSQYNGNIAGMTTAMLKDDETGAEVQGRAFAYDQLYRIKTSTAFHSSASNLYNNGWQTTYTQDNRYSEAFTHDWNGNIKTVDRYSGDLVSGTAVKSDAFTYNYATNSNLLTHIDDAQAACAYTDDVDDQSGNNYLYDAIGEMTDDVSERIIDIEWTPYGKVKAVRKDQAINTNSCTSLEYTDSDVEFLYTASQQRLCKIVKPHKLNGAGISDQDEWIYYWYSYDAGGNLMGVYKQSFEDLGSNSYKVKIDLQEHGVYGSGRTGMRHADDESDYYQNFTSTMTAGRFATTFSYTGNSAAYIKTHYTRTIGYKQYEVSNHLGNMLVTVSDKRLLYSATPSTATQVDWYVADVQSYGDYYVFGAMQTGRAGGSYRYGFNGKENDNEINNVDGSWQDYGMRMYDPRVGRFFSSDPLKFTYPYYSPYQFAGNMPLSFIDVDGMEPGYAGEAGQVDDATDARTGRMEHWIWTECGEWGIVMDQVLIRTNESIPEGYTRGSEGDGIATITQGQAITAGLGFPTLVEESKNQAEAFGAMTGGIVTHDFMTGASSVILSPDYGLGAEIVREYELQSGGSFADLSALQQTELLTYTWAYGQDRSDLFIFENGPTLAGGAVAFPRAVPIPESVVVIPPNAVGMSTHTTVMPVPTGILAKEKVVDYMAQKDSEENLKAHKRKKQSTGSKKKNKQKHDEGIRRKKQKYQDKKRLQKDKEGRPKWKQR